MIDAIIIIIIIIIIMAIIIASDVNRFDAISEMLVNFEFTIMHGGKEGEH